MRQPFRLDKFSIGGGVMGAAAAVVSMLILLRVPGMAWFLAATLAAGAVLALVLSYLRRP
jgi:hypothetical protein